MMEKENDRENRIMMEIIVDAYDEEERAMGWYYYLEEMLKFPFSAKCVIHREISPLRIGEKVEVIEMASERECEKEIFVTIKLENGALAVPLVQLKPIHAEKTTIVAVEDWHYWKARGYEF